MNEQTWTVVQFIDDGTVEAVPSIWIQGEKCHWPTVSQQKLVNAIRNFEPLNTCWPCHSVRIFRNGTFDNYFKARSKARLAEDTSDLNTANEDETITKRKVIQKKLSSSDSSISDSVLPTPPKIKKKMKPALLERKTKAINMESNDCNMDSYLSDTENNHYIETNIDSTDIINISATQVGCHNCAETEKHLKTIIQQNHLLRSLMSETLTEVRSLKEKIQFQKVENRDTTFFTKYPEISFPINTQEELDRLEDILSNPDEFQNVVAELSNLGGANNYNFVKRALTSIVSNEIAIKYSWLGRKTKKDFHSLLLAKMIISAAEKAKVATSKKETEMSIQNWLRRSGDRKNQMSKKM